MIGPNGQPDPDSRRSPAVHRRVTPRPGWRNMRQCCAPPNARRSCAATTPPGRPAAHHGRREGAPVRRVVSPYQARKDALREHGRGGRAPLDLRAGQPTPRSCADGYKTPAGTTPKVVRVNPGTVLVQARPLESASGKVVDRKPNSWYVLNDDPVLTGADITNPQMSSSKAQANHRASPTSFSASTRRARRPSSG